MTDLMIFSFPYCLVTAACNSQTSRFEAWPAQPWLVPLTAENWLQPIEPSWSPPTPDWCNVWGSLPPKQPHLQLPKQHKCIAHTNHGSHNSRKAFLHGAEGFPHEPPKASLGWLNLLPQPMLSSSQLFSPFLTSSGWWGAPCVGEG